MTKILYIINYLKNSGPSRVVLNLLKTINKSRFDVTIITLKNEDDEKIINELKQLDIDVIQFKYSSNREIIKNIRKIRDLINSENSDIIHSHGIIPDFIISSSIICSKKITTIHNNMFEDYILSYGKFKGTFMCNFHIMILKKFDKVVCCSKSSYDSLKNKIRNLSYIRNGSDVVRPLKSELRKKIGIPQNAFVYIYCGVLTKGKRVIELIDKFNSSLKENEYLLILGDGPLYEEVVKCSNDYIKVLGFQKNVMEFYSISNVYVSNSSSEGFSMSIIEALGCNLYLLLSDIPSHKECFFIDNKTYLGEYFNDDNFVEKKNILSEKIKVENNSRLSDFQEKYLSSRSMTNEYEKSYSSLVK